MVLPPATLRLAFERPDRRYAPGETIRGRISMAVTTGFQCSRLDVTLSYATHGRGDVDKRVAGGTTLVAETFFAPGHVELPFELSIPAGATPTHRGRVVNLDWYVAARADVSLAIDPNVTEDILVLASPPIRSAQPPASFSTLLAHPPPFEQAALTYAGGNSFTMSSRASAVLGIAIAGSPLALMLGTWWRSSSQGKAFELHDHSVFGFILIPFGLYMFGTSMKKLLARAALARLELHVGPVLTPEVPAFSRGAPFGCVAVLATAGRARMERVTFRLLAVERATKGSGTREETFTDERVLSSATVTAPHQRHDARFDPYRKGQADAGDPFAGAPAVTDGCAEYRALLSIPWDAPTPFELGRNTVKWQLHLVVALANAPDWDERYDVYELR